MISWALLTSIAMIGAIPADTPDATGGQTSAPLKVVVHVNFSDSDQQGHGLKNVMNILKDAPDTQVEVVCHALGIGLVVKEQSKHAETVEALRKRGVRFVACENTMRDRSIRKEDLLPGVGTVPSGALEVVRKQQQGYSYFKP